MSVFHENMLIGSSGQGGAAAGYQVSRSLRFSSGDSSYLSRTPASAGDRKKWTFSLWLKRQVSAYQQIFTVDGTTEANYFQFAIENNDKLAVRIANNTNVLVSTQVFRDPSAWYHIVLTVDTAQATSANRLRVYVNGVEITAFDTASYPTQSADLNVNTTNSHLIGRAKYNGYSASHSDCYMADIWFLDGIAATPSDFAETDATTGQWIPKTYSGSKGSNGFHLEFADNSAATAAALGKDTSGNNNNWSPSNFQVVNQTNYVSGSSTYRQSTSANQNWNSSSSASSTSSALSPDRIFWVDLGSSQSFNKVTFTCVAANNTGNYASNFIVYYSTSGSSTGSSICNGGCTVTKVPVTSGPTPGTITVEFSGISAVSGQYIGITNGTGADTGTYTYSNLQVALSNPQNNDSLVDTPTSYGTGNSGGDVRGNFCTWNPLSRAGGATYSQGNLEYVGTLGGVDTPRTNATISVSTGKWYYEVTLLTAPGSPRNSGSVNNSFGWGLPSVFNKNSAPNTSAMDDAVFMGDSGWYKNFTGSNTDSGYGFASGDVLGVAVDLDANTFAFYKNGTSIVTGTIGGTAGRELTPTCASYSGTYGAMAANFGQRPFAYPVSGYKALCDTNLTAPVIAKPSESAFDVKLYTGNGSTQSISGLGFSPDLVVIKRRSAAENWTWTDVVRGATKTIYSNLTNAEGTDTNGLTAFNSSGFSVGSDTAYNASSSTYAAFCFDAGANTVTNNVGSITSSVRANASAGFSIVTWTNPSTANQTIGHGLNVKPAMIIRKYRNNADGWVVYHTSLGQSSGLFLNTTGAASADANLWPGTINSTVFSTGNLGYFPDGWTAVAYCFAPVAGYSSMGSYVGNGSTDGVFVFTGHQSRWLMVKRTDTTSQWSIWDTARNTYNASGTNLWADSSEAEATSSNYDVDFLSNGFKMRNTHAARNASGGTYIYISFAQNPFQYARAR